jgi:hypothetical protein
MNPVESFIYNLGQPESEIAEILRHFILSLDPSIREKIAYGIPFFYKNKNICYLNPSSGGIDLGFVRGSKLQIQHPGIESKNRKMVRTIFLKKVDDIDFELLLSVMKEALYLDEK